jgi:uncharacterized protein YbjT (DUF2867 family)
VENSNRTILITGATGHQGGAVAHHLLKRGKFNVRALVRNERKPAAIALERSGAELFVDDFNDRSSLEHLTSCGYGIEASWQILVW